MKFKFGIIALFLFFWFSIHSSIGDENDDGFDDKVDGSGDMNVDDMDGYGDNPYGGYGANPYGGYGDGPSEKIDLVKELNSFDEIQAFLTAGETEASVIGYFDQDNDISIFKEVASSESGNRFAYTTNKQILEDKKYDNSVVILHLPTKFVNEKYERSKYRYPSKSLNAATLSAFIAEKSIPILSELSNPLLIKFQKLSIPVLMVFTTIDHQKNPKGYQYFVNRLYKISEFMKGSKMYFVIADKTIYSELIEN
eukprot:gene17601-24456_t